MHSPTLTDLEARLASPEGQAVRDELTARLDSLAGRLRAEVASGLSRDDYSVWTAAIDAVMAAQDVLGRHPVAPRSMPSSPAPFPIPSHLR